MLTSPKSISSVPFSFLHGFCVITVTLGLIRFPSKLNDWALPLAKATLMSPLLIHALTRGHSTSLDGLGGMNSTLSCTILLGWRLNIVSALDLMLLLDGLTGAKGWTDPELVFVPTILNGPSVVRLKIMFALVSLINHTF